MEEYILIKVAIKEMSEDVKIGDYVKYNGVVYKFKGYGYDSILVQDVETGEDKELKWY